MFYKIIGNAKRIKPKGETEVSTTKRKNKKLGLRSSPLAHEPSAMAMLSKLFLALLLVANLTAFADDIPFTFNGFKRDSLTLSEHAEIGGGGLLQLTNNTKQITGHAFYPSKLRFKNESLSVNAFSFSTTFVFAITPLITNVSGHGLSFLLAPSTAFSTAISSQHLGLFPDDGGPQYHIVAVELDTVQNAEFDDINDNHVGVDVNSLKSIESKPVGFTKDGSFQSLQLISGHPMQVWVDYDGERSQIDIAIAPLHEAKPRDSLVSTKLNLSSIILDEMYVGFSSSTGAASGCHYILGWSFALNRGAPPLDLSNLPHLPHLGHKSRKALATPLSLAGAILLLLVGGAIFLVLERRKKFAEVLEDWELEYGPHRFSYRDLYSATKGFSEENLLGVGGFGRVYKGVLPKSNLEIAVKKISHESKQGIREFVAEIASMGRLRHRHLVPLLGYCRRQFELLLVYDYMPNGSLDKFLFDSSRPPLNWSQRFHIIRGVASGLLYLHEEWEQVVIHRDIKAGNVLLDREFNPKLGDFGLARLYDHGSHPQTTHIMGTLGYLAPEFSKTGKATTHTDAYAFGAFLLEVACGKRPIELHAPADMPVLVDRVLWCWKTNSILEACDPLLGDEFSVKEVELVLKLGLSCSHPDPLSRPSMRQVVQLLEGEASLPTMSPDGFMNNLAAKASDLSFDDFVSSCPSASAPTIVSFSSPLFSAAR
ncbi:L-type lectin-domain containing receptor kinase SIT2-like [Zingiber officinale]|uniref:L-type lectin-domain containing receptor kinase SIT2-like n=1 Tax=Zingiber officinale TaxID=94328 RepID=UPI001C4D3AD1|nr:L-type lectin-domain containing receptor kinase SIT2-like [Zingiber officinale]